MVWGANASVRALGGVVHVARRTSHVLTSEHADRASSACRLRADECNASRLPEMSGGGAGAKATPSRSAERRQVRVCLPAVRLDLRGHDRAADSALLISRPPHVRRRAITLISASPPGNASSVIRIAAHAGNGSRRSLSFTFMNFPRFLRRST